MKPTLITCDVIKYAYRQSKDGFIVSFVVHPQEMPAELANADIGSQWQLSLVPLDEHGNARLRDSQDAADQTAAGEADAGTTAWTAAASPSKQRKPVAPEKRLAQQAGICCADPVFRTFLNAIGAYTVRDEEGAARVVRHVCSVDSRSKIAPDSEAADKWEKLYGRFLAWRDHDMPAGEAA